MQGNAGSAGVLHKAAIRLPRPAAVPAQQFLQAAAVGPVALCQPALHALQARLAFLRDHLQHQRALRPLPLQGREQPAVRGVVGLDIVALAQQHALRPGHALREACLIQRLPSGQVDDAARHRLRPGHARQREQAQQQPAALRTPH